MGVWTPEEVDILVANYNLVTNKKLEELIPSKTYIGIYKKARRMGLLKSPDIEFQNRSIARKGEKSSNWKGGTRKTRKGYKQVLIPEHHRADKSGYVMEHIVVWENATGVGVPKNCCVHHLNGDKADNRIENLCLMEFGAHTTLHCTGRKLSDEARNKISEKRRKHKC